MRNFILSLSFIFLAFFSPAQNVLVQVDQVNVDVQQQDGILLVSAFGEPVVGMDFNQGVALISGFYPVSFFDTTGTSGMRVTLPIESLTAFPNPTKDFLVLRIIAENHPEFFVSIHDPSGKILEHTTWKAGQMLFELPFEAFASGTYFVGVTEPDEGRVSYFQVVKQ